MVTLKGEQVVLKDSLVEQKQTVPDFELVAQNLERVSLNAYEGQLKILNIFPSLDTEVCAQSLKEFQSRASNLEGVALLNISKDLPFAQTRFCLAQKQKKAITLSAFDSSFGEDYGLLIQNGPLKGLLARCVLILNIQNKIIYKELVSEITQEPNYGQALENLENYQTLES